MNNQPTPGQDNGGLHSATWVTRVQMALLGLTALLCGFFATTAWPTNAARAQGPAQGGPPGRGGFGGFGGMQQEDRPVLAQFDADKNKRLDAAERKAAREWLATQPAGGGFGRRGGGGRGGFGGRGIAAGSPGPRLSPADVKPVAAEVDLYDPRALRTIFIQFEETDWEAQLEAFHNTDVDVPATVIVDGQTYKDVGVRFRGASSYMMVPTGSKRSLNLSFDYAHDKQALGGYRTINLLNANSDPTFVRGVLYSEIARSYIPAPRINYARVVVGDESWGIYLNAEQFNKDFLRTNYRTDEGARWKVPGSPNGRGGMEYLGDDVALYKRTYDIKSKDDPKSWAALIRLFKVLNETPPEKLEAALEPMLDVDGALRFLALDVALVNSDGFWARASDYNIYQDDKGRFHVIPHDVNEALADEGGGGRGRGRGPFGPPPPGADGPPPGVGGPPPGPGGPPAGGRQDVFIPPPGGRGFGRGGAGVDLDPLVGLDDTSKALRVRLLAVPALRAKYLTYVRDIAEKWLDWNKLGPLVQERQALIAADVKTDTRKLYSTEAFTTGVSGAENSLRSFIERRRAFLLK